MLEVPNGCLGLELCPRYLMQFTVQYGDVEGYQEMPYVCKPQIDTKNFQLGHPHWSDPQ